MGQMKIRIITVIAALILVIGFAFYHYVNSRINNAFTPTITKEVVKSDVLDESLYLMSKSWGMTDDKQIIVLSNSEETNFDPKSKNEYVFSGLSVFFYEIKTDTLKIYIEKKSPMPINFKTKFKIEQHELENSDLMRLYKTHKEKGIKMFGSSASAGL
jgi:hypothetical protein